MANPALSNIERDFIVSALSEARPERIDGRRPYDHRSVAIAFPSAWGVAVAQIGRTRVLSRVSCEMVIPSPDRPTEGSIRFYVDCPKDKLLSSTIASTIEKCVRNSGAIDVETLCIISGVRSWALRVDVFVLDQCGNAIDAVCLAVLASLRHFRRPAVTVIGTDLTVHPEYERPPVALQLHHLPICTSFAVIGDRIVADPSDKEHRVAGSHLTIATNTRKHVCLMMKSGGTPITQEQVTDCISIACQRSEFLTGLINAEIDANLTARRERLEKGDAMAKTFSPEVRLPMPSRVATNPVDDDDESEQSDDSQPETAVTGCDHDMMNVDVENVVVPEIVDDVVRLAPDPARTIGSETEEKRTTTTSDTPIVSSLSQAIRDPESVARLATRNQKRKTKR
uniref:Uncharacterized protein n=1 Tax=Spongospora subterranea TaxID=70186 RepID=A0A0H5RC70_9EUKA|eukprot:CRZ11346.1 hypothetical protein [Spongospora subterranea]